MKAKKYFTEIRLRGFLLVAGYLAFLPSSVCAQTTFDKTFGELTEREYGFSVLQTSDGGYIIAGTTGGYDGLGNADGLVIKTDANGSTQWEQRYSRVLGTGSDDYLHSIYPTMDGGYILAPGCEYTPNLPLTNAFAMVHAAERCS